MNSAEDYIGVMDSGVGGLSVLLHLRKHLPGEKFLYFGDSANAPYGVKSREEIRELAFAAAEHIISRGVKALVVACNTATAAAINELRSAYPQLIIIGIEPALKLAADRFPGGTIGVMATTVTLREEKFAALLRRCEGSATVYKLPAPGLVELIESGRADSPQTEEMLRSIFSVCEKPLDALVLGCTHYPFAAAAISRVLGSGVTLLDGGDGTARETKRRLEQAGLLENGEGQLIIENSLPSPEIMALSRQLLGI